MLVSDTKLANLYEFNVCSGQVQSYVTNYAVIVQPHGFLLVSIYIKEVGPLFGSQLSNPIGWDFAIWLVNSALRTGISAFDFKLSINVEDLSRIFHHFLPSSYGFRTRAYKYQVVFGVQLAVHGPKLCR